MKFRLTGGVLPLALLAVTKLAAGVASRATVDHQQQPRRKLLDQLAGYKPRTIVTDEAAIDLDAHYVAKELASRRKPTASAIYIAGSNSKSVATLRLDDPLPIPVAEGTALVGLGNGAVGVINGYALDHHSAGIETIRFVYSAVGDQENYMNCRVGASPTPVTTGCLVDDGFLDISGYHNKISYKYKVINSTVNARTLELFSQKAQEHYGKHDDFQKYLRYYGRYDYADHWIKQAFLARNTQMISGNAFFQVLSGEGGDDATSAAINWGVLLLTVWMEVVGNLDRALDICNEACAGIPDSGCNDLSSHRWEQSVAYYVGSLQRTGAGIMLYQHAERLCTIFHTCNVAVNDTSIANSNRRVMNYFELGRNSLDKGLCIEARKYKSLVSLYMTVPLVQHTIQMAHELESRAEPSAAIKAEAATAAAAILPLIHNCSVGDATYIYERMKLGSDLETIRARDIKRVLERNYHCLNLLCEDVGGLMNDATGMHYPGLGICHDHDLPGYPGGSTNNAGLIAGLVFAGLWVFFFSVIVALRFCGDGVVDSSNVEEPEMQGDAVAA